ncbi:MAG: sugar ABC transporter permease [Chloroflexi bacterium]|nr:sugar ABC transporter permease [Chloroflexota bacterium]
MAERTLSTPLPVEKRKPLGSPALRENLLAYLFLAPAIIAIVLVLFYPILNLLITSFYSRPTFTRPSTFIGIKNYLEVLNDPIFPLAVKNTVIWTFGVTIGQVILGMYFALMLHRRFPGRWLARMLVIVPWVLPGIVVAVTWRFMYSQDFGLINLVLRSIGLEQFAQSWLGSRETAMIAVIIVGIWKGFGFYALMFLAGLQTIPTELYESARIDGAGERQQLRYITLPLLRPVAITSTVLGLIWTSNYFDAIFVLTGGGPARSTETLPMFIYNTAFSFYRTEEAMAGSNILMVIVLLLLAFYLLVVNRGNALQRRVQEGES